ncbi:MAG: hypothetical protein KDD58_04350 [Bdellovibrionales bacterium]|nr:hypothetical protein [Bdellovibrionales bacterium]
MFVLDKSNYENFKNNTPAQWNGNIQENIGNKNFTEPYSTSIKNITLHMGYKVQAQSAVENEGEYPFFAYLLQPKVTIDSISTQDLVKERQGQLIINVKIDGKCEKLNLLYKQNYLPVNGIVKLESVNGKAQLKLKSFKFNYSGSLWDMNFASCLGPKGYEEVLKKNIKKYIDDKNLITDLIQRGIENQLTVATQDINERVLQPQFYTLSEDVKLSIYPYLINIADDGAALLKGLISVEFVNNKSQQVIYVPLDDFSYLSTSESKFILPASLVQKTLKAIYNNGLFRQLLYPQKIEGFKELLSSRFKQFFVWPDLANFSKKTDFIFDIYPYSIPEVTQMQMENQSLKIGTITNIANNMLMPKNSIYEPYVNFYARTAIDVILDIDTHGIKVNFKQPRFNSAYKFDKKYIQENNPNEYIDIKMLQEGLGKALVQQEFHYDLGPLDLNLWGMLYPQRFNLTNNYLELIYSPGGFKDRPLQKTYSKPWTLTQEQDVWEFWNYDN